jgi:hypothetical protein
LIFFVLFFGFLNHGCSGNPLKSPPPTPDVLVRQDYTSLPDEQGLSFPFDPPSVIVRLMSFGVPDWNQGLPYEDHFGIDLIPFYDYPNTGGAITRVRVVAPTDGVVRGIWGFDSDDPAGNKDICVFLEINAYWSVILMFEPKCRSGAPVAEQVRSISVKAGQTVHKGDEIGYLVVGEGFNRFKHYPHVHYALMYKSSSTSYWEILNDIDPVPNLRPTDIPEQVWPWAPLELTLPGSYTAAFFCPYEFSTPRAKAIIEYVFNNSVFPCGPELEDCGCICIYNGKCDR